MRLFISLLLLAAMTGITSCGTFGTNQDQAFKMALDSLKKAMKSDSTTQANIRDVVDTAKVTILYYDEDEVDGPVKHHKGNVIVHSKVNLKDSTKKPYALAYYDENWQYFKKRIDHANLRK